MASLTTTHRRISRTGMEDSSDRPTRKEYDHLPLQDSDGEEVEAQEVLSIDEAIEFLGMGTFQYIVMIACGMCFAADAMQVMLLSFLVLILKDLWSLSDQAMSFMTSLLFAGALVGTLILGPFADSKGRRPAFLLSAGIISLFGLLSAVSPTYSALCFCLFVVGCGVGGLVVQFDLLAEFLPSQGRGTNLLRIQYFWTLGCLYVVLVAYLTLLHHWRWCVALTAIPCATALTLGYFFVPESARWLVSQGRNAEALVILQQAAIVNGKTYPEGVSLRQEEQHTEASIRELFEPQWLPIILRLWGVWGAFAFGYYGLLIAETRVFESKSSSSNEANFDFTAIFWSSSAEFVGTTLVIFTVDRFGRISSQFVTYVLAGTFICALGVLADNEAERPLLMSLAFLARVFEMAATCVTWVSTAEILTTEVRTTGHSTANAMARIGAFFCPFVVQGMPLLQVGVIMLFVHLFTAACVSKLPETKGKTMGTAPISTEPLVGVEEDDEEDQDDAETSRAEVVEDDDDPGSPGTMT